MTDQRPAARSAIDAISPDTSPGFVGPETSVGAGLVEAQTMLTGGAVACDEPHIVLLDRRTRRLSPVLDCGGSGRAVCALRSTPAPPASMRSASVRMPTTSCFWTWPLSQAASSAILTKARGLFFLLSRLADFYKTVDEDVRGEQRFFYAEGFPEATIPIRDKPGRVGYLDVEPSLDWMTVAFHADQDNAATVELWPPGATGPIRSRLRR